MKAQLKVVIPARYGSSRLPGKPLLLLNEKPMYWHVVQRTLEAGIKLEDIVIATDDERIVQSAKEEFIPVQLTASSHVSGTDRINEVAMLKNWDESTIVLNVQGDEPLIPASLIADLAKFTRNNPKFAITTAVTPIQSSNDFQNPNVVKAILGEGGRALYFTRSPSPLNRDEPESYSHAFRHIGIYAYRVGKLKEFCSYEPAVLEELEKLEQLRALSHGMEIGSIVIDEAPPHGVDTLEDYNNLKELMNS